MFGEGSAFGFVPAPVIDLRAGNLYNVIISLLIFLVCVYVARAIFLRGQKGLPEKTFVFFLASVGLYWLLAAVGNLLAWLNVLAAGAWIAYPLKVVSVLPLVTLAYYFSTELLATRTAQRRLTFYYGAIAALYLLFALRIDRTESLSTYWGVQWLTSYFPQLIYVFGLLLPLAAAAILLVLKSGFISTVERRTVNASLYLGGIIFVLLEYLELAAVALTWQRLLIRLLYILIAFGIYLYFTAQDQARKFVPREETVSAAPQPRISFFTKLLCLFILLAVVPIAISSLLMFVSFKEIIDLYIYKPLLWNLKTSREAFLLALTYVQIQAFFLMLLTGLLVTVAAILASRAIARSLRNISEGMGKVSRGDFSFKLVRESNDEVGDVVTYFNDMSLEIKRARDVMENWNRELEVKVAERTEDLRVLFDVSRAAGSSLDLELLIRRTMERIGVSDFSLLNPDQTVRFAGGAAAARPDALRLPIKAKGAVVGTLVLAARPELAQKKTLLETITDQLGIALENIGIYEKEKEAVARLTELDRMKNEFISMVSHELRTPVTSADGYVSLFLAGVAGPLNDDQKKYLTIVKENNARLLTLINRLLDFSKIETGRFTVKRELLSLHEVIGTLPVDLKPQLDKKGATLRLLLSAKNSNVMGDREKLTEVFSNLIENALKFGCDNVPLVIELATREAGDFIEVDVTDNGAGLAAEYLEKIFNKFFQVEATLTRQAGGVGLGLTIVREIIGNHHGKIWAESAGPGLGTTFKCLLPVAEKI